MNFKTEAAYVYARLKDIQPKMNAARGAHRDAKIRFERLNHEMVDYVRARTLEVVRNMGEIVDPRTKKSNVEFSKMVTDERVQSNDEFQRKITELREAQAEVYMTEVTLGDLSEELGSLRVSANLIGAYLNASTPVGSPEV